MVLALQHDATKCSSKGAAEPQVSRIDIVTSDLVYDSHQNDPSGLVPIEHIAPSRRSWDAIGPDGPHRVKLVIRRGRFGHSFQAKNRYRPPMAGVVDIMLMRKPESKLRFL